MSRLILVRHSEPIIDPAVDRTKWQLSPNGQALSRSLARWLHPHTPHSIITSTENKAIETGRILAEMLEIPRQTMKNLHEHERPDVGYMQRHEFEENVQAFFERPNELVFGSETAEAAYQRYNWAIGDILVKYAGQNIVVVSHGTVMSLFVSRNIQVNAFDLWKRLGAPSYVVLEVPRFELVEVIESVQMTDTPDVD